MPFHINNVTSEITFSNFEITDDILSGVSEIFPYIGMVDVFDGDKLIATGRIHTVYEKYEDKNIIYKRHSENSKLEKEKVKKKLKTKRKTRSKPTPAPHYKLVNENEPDLYVNKKFLT